MKTSLNENEVLISKPTSCVGRVVLIHLPPTRRRPGFDSQWGPIRSDAVRPPNHGVMLLSSEFKKTTFPRVANNSDHFEPINKFYDFW